MRVRVRASTRQRENDALFNSVFIRNPTVEIYNDHLLYYGRETVIKLYHKLLDVRAFQQLRFHGDITPYLPFVREVPSSKISRRKQKDGGLNSRVLGVVNRLRDLYSEELPAFERLNAPLCKPYANLPTFATLSSLELPPSPIPSPSPSPMKDAPPAMSPLPLARPPPATQCAPSFIVIGDDTLQQSSFYNTLTSHLRLESSSLNQLQIYRCPTMHTLYDNPIGLLRALFHLHPLRPGHTFRLGKLFSSPPLHFSFFRLKKIYLIRFICA